MKLERTVNGYATVWSTDTAPDMNYKRGDVYLWTVRGTGRIAEVRVLEISKHVAMVVKEME